LGFLACFRSLRSTNRMVGMNHHLVGPIFQCQTEPLIRRAVWIDTVPRVILLEAGRDYCRINNAITVVVHLGNFSLPGVCDERLTLVLSHIDDVIGNLFHPPNDSDLLAKNRSLRLKKPYCHCLILLCLMFDATWLIKNKTLSVEPLTDQPMIVH